MSEYPTDRCGNEVRETSRQYVSGRDAGSEGGADEAKRSNYSRDVEDEVGRMIFGPGVSCERWDDACSFSFLPAFGDRQTGPRPCDSNGAEREISLPAILHYLDLAVSRLLATQT
ncbi:hypothetical protein ANO11243_019780 [Dothideomycetidae sp. 11243]|nr:hypothetical protein ANO11243_019780 [fungal sp. No.11243]